MTRIVFIICLLLSLGAIAQPQKKQPKKPSQNENERLLREAQQAIDDLSPEYKRMMDSMGVKLPSMKDLPKAKNEDWNEAPEDENRNVPKRDGARIAAIPKAVTDARMKAYLTEVQKKLSATLKPELIATGKKIHSYLQSLQKSPAETGNMALGFFIAGKPQLALYLMGEICAKDPGNLDNLNNYAALLSMQGAQHLAIPILNNINGKHPQNSTVLNNLGQAWFGLGELSKAEKYLDSAIRLYAYHPQANQTKALIEESRGHLEKAVDHLKKSIKHSYSRDKEEKLKKLGHQLTLENLHLPFKPGPDPLGLNSTRRPDYPKSLEQLRSLKPAWQQFNDACDARINSLKKQLDELTKQYAADMMKAAGGNVSSIMAKPLFIKKGSLALERVKDYYEPKIQRLGETGANVLVNLSRMRAERKRAAPEAPCTAHRDLESDFLNRYNAVKQAADDEALEVFRHYLNELVYWSQFTSTDETMFELIRLNALMEWLIKNREYQPLLYSEYELLECVEPEEAEPGELSEFDLVACKYKDTLDLAIMKIASNCSRMTSEFDFMFLKYVRNDDFHRAEGDTYIGSTVAISAEIGEGLNAGPLKAEAKLGAGIEFEFSRAGLEDVLLIAEAKLGAGTNILDENVATGSEGIGLAGKDAFPTTVEVGVEGKISLISGHGMITTNSSISALKDIKLANW